MTAMPEQTQRIPDTLPQLLRYHYRRFGNSRIAIFNEDPLFLLTVDINLRHFIDIKKLISNFFCNFFKLTVGITIASNRYDSTKNIAVFIIHKGTNDSFGKNVRCSLNFSSEGIP